MDMDDAMTYLISNLFLVACYIVSTGRAPVVLAKSPIVKARIAAYTQVRAFAYGAELTEIDARAEMIRAYNSRKVTITDFGTSILVQARHGKSAADTRFVVQP